ncbi:MAG: transcription elongation factor GreA [Clostridia bacterium]|nr:transcription elongation factor GreA [Clostridia bacterium]
MYNELTEIDIKNMQREIDHRIQVERPRISELIIEAKAHGDLSENGEYHEARREKGRNESRIEYLRDMTMTAKIIKTNQNKNVVGIFDKVTLFFENENETDFIILSTTIGQNPAQKLISKESPLGKAIMGRKVGDRILVQVSPTKKYYVEIKAIEKGNNLN